MVWIEHVRALPCLVCRRPAKEAHHLLRTGEHGMGQKSPHRFAVPLCGIHHRELHRSGDEEGFFLRHAINPYGWVEKEYEAFHARRHF